MDLSIQRLKTIFTSAHILFLPDPHILFVVDTSDVGTGVLLSQHCLGYNKFHPCICFSQKLLSAGRHNDWRRQSICSCFGPIIRILSIFVQPSNSLAFSVLFVCLSVFVCTKLFKLQVKMQIFFKIWLPWVMLLSPYSMVSWWVGVLGK